MSIKPTNYFRIEPTNVCNLRCKLCPTNNSMTRKRGFMSLQSYKKIIYDITPFAKYLDLWHFGEPFLHPRMCDMINYAKEKGLNVRISTNVTPVNDRKIDEIIDAGLDTLIVCLEGASKETHEKYRAGSIFEDIVCSIRNICRRKKTLNNNKPLIILQVLATKANESELPKVFTLANRLGVDKLRIKTLSLGSWTSRSREFLESWVPSNAKLRRYEDTSDGLILKRGENCEWAYKNGVVLWNGDLTICCYDYNGEHVFANVLEEKYTDILKSNKMKKVRERINEEDFDLCSRCQKTNSLIVEEVKYE